MEVNEEPSSLIFPFQCCNTGKAWEKILSGNDHSFETVYNRNVDTCPTTLEKVIANSHEEVWKRF